MTPETNNEALPTRLPPMEEQQNETQYSECHKDTTRKDCEVKKIIRFKEIGIVKEI